MTTDVFNQSFLRRQKLQIINSAYVQISYIQKECKPYLHLFQNDLIPMLKTNENLKFQTVQENNIPEEKENILTTITGSNSVGLVNLNQTGRYVVFPAGKFQIFWNPLAPTFTKEDLETIYTQWISTDIDQAVEKNVTILIAAPKLFVIESSMLFSLKGRIKKMYLGEEYPILSKKENVSV